MCRSSNNSGNGNVIVTRAEYESMVAENARNAALLKEYQAGRLVQAGPKFKFTYDLNLHDFTKPAIVTKTGLTASANSLYEFVNSTAGCALNLATNAGCSHKGQRPATLEVLQIPDGSAMCDQTLFENRFHYPIYGTGVEGQKALIYMVHLRITSINGKGAIGFMRRNEM